MGPPRLSPDGEWIIFQAEPGNSPKETPPSLYRVPVSGGTPLRLFEVKGLAGYSCAGPATRLCAFATLTEDKRTLTITGFDPLAGKGEELLQVALAPGLYWWAWELSPDGAQVALVETIPKAGENDASAGAEIRLLPFHGGEGKVIPLKGYGYPVSVDWAPDSKSMFVGGWKARAPSILHADLNGVVQSTWQAPEHNYAIWGIPSPDGRHLAVVGGSTDSNVWMIENF
ncbi:MAG: hypothetical protein ABSD20_05390 [Terriglobales bacterium]